MIASTSNINSIASTGVKAANRWHLMGRMEKNLGAGEQALDQVALASDSAPAFSKDLMRIRGVAQGMPAQTKLAFDRGLLESLSRHGAQAASGGLSPTLMILIDAAHAGARTDDSGQLYDAADKLFNEMAGASSDPMTRTVAQMKSTSMSSKLALTEEFYLDDEEYGQDAANFLGKVEEEDRPVMHAFLADQLKAFRPDEEGQKANQLLAGLSQLPQGDSHDYAVELAFTRYGFGDSAHEIADFVRDYGISADAHTAVDRLEAALTPQMELDFSSREPQQLDLGL